MPLYDFLCPDCGYQIEVLQMSPDLTVGCLECDSLMERVFSAPPMIKIKGAGGYPSRRKQIRNTTKQTHPKLEHEPHRVYF